MSRNNPFQSWLGFPRALEMEFGTSPYDCPRSILFKMNQTTTVHDYYVEFTALANRVHGLSPDAILDCFLSGLKPDIRREVLAQSPFSLTKAVALAKLFKEKYQPKPKPFFPSSTRHVTPIPSYTQPSKQPTLPPLLPTPPYKPHLQTPKPTQIKYVSAAEIQLRRDKGLCFTCDEKFSHTHRCPNRQYLLLIGDEDDPPNLDPDPPDQPNPEPDQPHLSFNALKGSDDLGTL